MNETDRRRDKEKLRVGCTDLALLTPRKQTTAPASPRRPPAAQLSLRNSLIDVTQKCLARCSPEPLEGKGMGTTFPDWAGTSSHPCTHKPMHTRPPLTHELQHTDTPPPTHTHTQSHSVIYSHPQTHPFPGCHAHYRSHTSSNIHTHTHLQTQTVTHHPGGTASKGPTPPGCYRCQPQDLKRQQGRLEGLLGSLRVGSEPAHRPHAPPQPLALTMGRSA